MRIFYLVCLLLSSSLSLALEALDEADLRSVSGQQGVMTDLELRFNAKADGSPVDGLNNCRSTNLCSIALQFANRSGWYTVYKDVYGSFILRDLKLNAAYTSATPSVYADDSRFLSSDGTKCLLDGTTVTTGCSAKALGQPAMQMAYTDPCPSGTINCRYETFTPKVDFHLQIGRTAVEDTPTSNARGSFMGLLLSDSRPGQLRAQIAIGGRAFLSGF